MGTRDHIASALSALTENTATCMDGPSVPGAMHTRFEHSLGVMHTVARLFDSITQTSMPVLESSELRFDPHSLQRQRRLIRLAAPLRDVGPSPFSHGSED